MQTEDKKTQENQHLEMPVYELDKIKIQPFDEITVGYLKTMQEQNNVYVGLRTQEEQLRVTLNNVRTALHDIKKMNSEELRTISFPYLAGYKTLTPATRKEFIQNNMKAYRSLETQYKAAKMQRIHRADELGETRIRVLKRLWNILVNEHDMKQEELYKMLDVNIPMPLIRPKEQIPILESKPINRIKPDIKEA